MIEIKTEKYLPSVERSKFLFKKGWRGTASWRDIVKGLRIPYKERKTVGKIYVSCILHNEKTPSMLLRPSGVFHCFGCGGSGDVIDFLAYKLLNIHSSTFLQITDQEMETILDKVPAPICEFQMRLPGFS